MDKLPLRISDDQDIPEMIDIVTDIVAFMKDNNIHDKVLCIASDGYLILEEVPEDES